MKTLQNLEAGDLIKNGRIELEIRDVIIKDKGEKTCYLLSQEDKRCAGGIYTAYELEKMGYAPYLTPEDKTEKLARTDLVTIQNWSGDSLIGSAFKINGKSYSAKEIIQALVNLDQVPF
jgi:hypothetical protein